MKPSAEAKEIAALTESLRESVGRFVRAIRTKSSTATTAQGEALAHLERSGPASIAALAQARGVTHQSMRLVVTKLHEAGSIALLPDPEDGRGYLVTLTPAGRAALAQGRRARARVLAEALATRLTAEERAALSRALPLLDRLGAVD